MNCFTTPELPWLSQSRLPRSRLFNRSQGSCLSGPEVIQKGKGRKVQAEKYRCRQKKDNYLPVNQLLQEELGRKE
jgi:hypothetical protein